MIQGFNYNKSSERSEHICWIIDDGRKMELDKDGKKIYPKFLLKRHNDESESKVHQDEIIEYNNLMRARLIQLSTYLWEKCCLFGGTIQKSWKEKRNAKDGKFQK